MMVVVVVVMVAVVVASTAASPEACHSPVAICRWIETHSECVNKASGGFAIKMNSRAGLMNIGASTERVHGGRKKQEWETQWW